MLLNIQLKTDFCDTKHTPTESAYWEPAVRATAKFMQGLNVILAEQLIHGPIKCDPEYTQVELALGDVCSPPNEAGVMTIEISNYRALKIPFFPPDAPCILYLGDTDEQIVKVDEKGNPVLDEEGNPIYETVYAGEIQ